MTISEDKYEAVIGLEVHAQLSTITKIFCGCSARFGAEPNSQTCPVCLGMPGVLPVLNEKAVEFAIKMGLATNCTISEHNVFARKNYFYPDLPKGYQISQFEHPICKNGRVEVETDGEKHTIRINRIHLEEDAGKSVHDEDFVDAGSSLVDLNRCGTPLIEIVTEPDLRTPQQAHAYLSLIRQLVRYLRICDGNMEQGSLRCDANVSVRRKGETELGTKTELKNMNSLRNVENALTYEIQRQVSLLESGRTVEQATLLWDPSSGTAQIMRVKEEAHDYRYFPDPDLVRLEIAEDYVRQLKKMLPELPAVRRQRFMDQYGLPEYDAEILTSSRELADYYEQTVKIINDAKLVSNWVLGDVLRVLNDKKIEIKEFPISEIRFAELLKLIREGKISSSAAKKVFDVLLTSDKSADVIVKEMGLIQVSDDSAIESMVKEVLAEYPDEVNAYKNGKTGLIGFFVGQVMRKSAGKANPKIVNSILLRLLSP